MGKNSNYSGKSAPRRNFRGSKKKKKSRAETGKNDKDFFIKKSSGKREMSVFDIENKFNSIFNRAMKDLKMEAGGESRDGNPTGKADQNSKKTGKGMGKKGDLREKELESVAAIKILSNEFYTFRNNVNKKLDIIISHLNRNTGKNK